MGGIFISFEGSEGCGKSTQIKRLGERLSAIGREVVITREPGGTPLGESIRQLLMHSDAGEGMYAETELLLFAASRAQLSRELIAPALAEGAVVLCDRYLDSTTVYQGVARRLEPADVTAINNFAVGSLRPDLTLLLDLPADTGIARARASTGGQSDRMEAEAIEFFEAVRRGYLELAAREPERIRVIDGSGAVPRVEEEIWNAFNQRFA